MACCEWDITAHVTHPALCQLCRVLTAFLLHQTLSSESSCQSSSSCCSLCLWTPRAVSLSRAELSPLCPPWPGSPGCSGVPRGTAPLQQQHRHAQPGGAGDNITEVKHNRKSCTCPFKTTASEYCHWASGQEGTGLEGTLSLPKARRGTGAGANERWLAGATPAWPPPPSLSRCSCLCLWMAKCCKERAGRGSGKWGSSELHHPQPPAC